MEFFNNQSPVFFGTKEMFSTKEQFCRKFPVYNRGWCALAARIAVMIKQILFVCLIDSFCLYENKKSQVLFKQPTLIFFFIPLSF